ncbi:large subunit ribosomal protein L1 [Methanocalculus alkaliphilus]|uniref:50S ribosomal protein L1 n=1 Tax=Methanocalculus alkaliphilus TaxID=768730 RepID=UPI00209D43D0|nr:50S ribosomal protein L1 [Methanocalculus alkaliphilus]MCP1714902.1 large subunit ribosomal protein L1 [Methanocalculus alkaliphilus]
MVDKTQILKAVSEAIELAPERKFRESVDLTVNLKNIDMAQPKNRIDETILLPESAGTKKIAVLGKGEITSQAKEAGVDIIIGPEEIERLGGAPREARQVACEYNFFLAETAVMPLVGRWLGPRLGPRGKMPMPIPPGQDIRPIVERLRGSIRVRTKDKMSFSAKVGTTEMSPEQITENINTILKRVESSLDQGPQNIRSVFVKTTMGPAVRVI